MNWINDNSILIVGLGLMGGSMASIGDMTTLTSRQSAMQM